MDLVVNQILCRLIKEENFTVKAKMYKKMTANDIKSYLSCLNELVDQNNNTYHNSINKKCINAGHFVFTEKN